VIDVTVLMGPDLGPDLTVREAATILNSPYRTFKRWVTAGLVPSYRLPNGRNVRIRRADIEAIRAGAAANQERDGQEMIDAAGNTSDGG